MPTISVVVPTRRRNHLLPRALDSILSQSFEDLEIVVVDDNPAELRISNQAALQKYLEDPRIRLVENPAPRNAAKARNFGLNVARGEWVTYLDDDDAYRPTKVERQLVAGSECGLPLGLCGLAYHLPCRLRELRRPGRRIAGDDLLLYFPGMPAVIHRRVSNVRFDEILNAGEDFHFYQQLLKHFQACEVFNVPEILIDVYVQSGLRVNLDAEGHLEAARMVSRHFASRYSPVAASVFMLRAQLGCCKIKRGELGPMLRLSASLLRSRGVRELRFIINCFLYKVPWIRRWLVS